MEHTPGPWMVFQEDENSPVTIMTQKTLFDDPLEIAAIYLKNDKDALPFEANARLIAAAPALLAACEGLVNDAMNSLDQGYEYVIDITTLKDLRDAIAAVRGEAETTPR